MKKHMVPESSAVITTNVSPAATEMKVGLDPAIILKKEEMLTHLCRFVTITDANHLQSAVEAVRSAKQLLGTVETARVAAKKPFLDLGKQIDQAAENFGLQVNQEIARVTDSVIAPFNEAEARRQEDAARLIEQEKAEAARKLAAAEAEQERINSLKRQSVQKEVQAAAAVENATVELEKAETRIVAPVAAASGMAAKMVVKYEVTDAAALYAARPEFFDLVPRASAMKFAIKKDTKLPGLKVWEARETKIRA